jgi:hypothetical protein
VLASDSALDSASDSASASASDSLLISLFAAGVEKSGKPSRRAGMESEELELIEDVIVVLSREVGSRS